MSGDPPGLDAHSGDRADLLERQKLETLGRVAGELAHEFGNILTPILGNGALAALEVTPGSDLDRYIERINAAAERAFELCRQLRAYSGRGHVEVERLDLDAAIQETEELLRATVRKNIALILERTDDPPYVDADRGQMQQLVINLVLNASEAIREHGSIVVRTGRTPLARGNTPLPRSLPHGSYVFVEVVDDGCGIGENVRQHLFEPFFSTKAGRSRGLGLAAAQGIARGHGGDIVVESAPDHGSTFRVYLPASSR